MIALLQPLFKGDWAPLAETLVRSAAPPAGAILVEDLAHDPGALGQLLLRHARSKGVHGGDLRAVASSWSMAYLDALLAPMVIAASVLHHCFPAQADRIHVLAGEDGTPLSFHFAELGSTWPGASPAVRFAPLIGGHLDPLFDAISRQTRLARKILWGNAARRLEGIFAEALQLAPRIARDRDHLLVDRLWPDGRANPMHGEQRTVTRAETPLKLHRQCCLVYLLPHEGFCGACPLAPQHRRLRGEG